jgi:hypothetical protein
VELLLVLPIMLMFVFSMIEFSLVFAAREHMAAACRAGARVAAQGGSREEIHATIRELLGKGRLGDANIEVVFFAEEISPEHRRHLRDWNMSRGKDSDQDSGMEFGEDSNRDNEPREEIDEPSPFLVDRERVAVAVYVPLTHVVPDALRWAGLSLRHHRLTAATVMNVE